VGPGERGLKRLIVTADDFGASANVNEAIEQAHRDGILTTASMMVAAPMAADAVERAKRLPQLRVGLHVVVVRGEPMLPPGQVPGLIDANGRLDDNLVRAGFRYFFLPAVRRQLAQEIRAQFEAFRANGLQLDHVNAHNHMHLHPTVLGLILEIGRDFGLKAVRLPFEPGAGALLAPWISLMKRRLKAAGVACNDYLFGIRDTGRMDAGALRRTIAGLPDGNSEVMLHPATGPWDGMEPEAHGFRYADEFQALIDPAVRREVESGDVELIGFSSLYPQT
jgi:hopanoid biosynthesis associated protein HpnK